MKSSSKEELSRYEELKILQAAGHISELVWQPKFYLQSYSGEVVATYTPDFMYKLNKRYMHISAPAHIVEEYKGSKDMWASKRRDYKIKVKWLMSDYPQYEFVENVGGVLRRPAIRNIKVNDDGFSFEQYEKK